MDSILSTIKKMLGIEEVYTHFDDEIIININSVFMTLTQLGVGPEAGFAITSKTETWSHFLIGETKIESVKTYIYLKVRLFFDPPSSSFVLEAMERQITELEWRLNVQVDKEIVEVEIPPEIEESESFYFDPID